MPAPIRKLFFVSGSFPWDALIYPGSGPGYARAHGWEARPLERLEDGGFDVALVENRLRPADIAHLERYLARPAGRRAPVLLKLSDPEMPASQDAGTRWVLAQADRPGVHFLSVYEPQGPLAAFTAGLARSRVVRAPYPYEPAREVEVPQRERHRRVLLAGASARRLYPERARWMRRRRWDPLVRLLTVHLPHPGYPDVGQARRHAVVGPAFVPFVARHTHLFVDGSRHQVELMKYLECAYAGCAPIGSLPPSLRGQVPPEVVRPARNVRDLVRALREPVESRAARAQAYREALRRARARPALEAALDASLDALLEAGA